MPLGLFHHFGVPTKEKQHDERYVETSKMWVTEPLEHPYNVEFLRFEDDSPLPEIIKSQPHVGFMVDSLDRLIKGMDIVLEPFYTSKGYRAAFIKDGDALIELMEDTNLK